MESIPSTAVTAETQVLVIGAGVIGCSIAYHLARRGASVIVLDSRGARKIANDSILRFPALKDAQIIRQFAGIRPLPKDGRPYLGPVKSVPGLFIATSHSGITLAPVHGKVISELILDGHTDVPLEGYRPERYTTVAGETPG